MIRLAMIFLVVFTLEANAQNWAPIGATWHYTWNSAFSTNTGSTKFEAISDTVISGKTCSKIIQQISFDNRRPNVEFTYIESDTVFFYDTSFAEFQILYDFNAEEGDFWYIRFKDDYPFFGDIDTVKIVVDSTDAVIINSVTLKKLYVTYEYLIESSAMSYSGVIIETLGDLNMMFNFFSFDNVIVDGIYSTGLRCYDDDSLGHYEATGVNGHCEFLSEIKELDSETIILHPNPSSEFISVNHDFDSYKIYSSDGRLMQQGESETDGVIMINEFQTGIYFLVLNSDQGSQTIRFVKK